MASGRRRAGTARRAFPPQCADEINLGKTGALDVGSPRAGRCASPVGGMTPGPPRQSYAPKSKQSGEGHARTLVPAETEAAMRNAIRGFLALSVLLWLMAALPGTARPHKGDPLHATALDQNENENEDDGSGPACGREPADADQVAAVRAMADTECDCSSATSHSDYVNCVDGVVDAAVANGSLRPECEGSVVSCAAQSSCGRPGAVTCCRTNSTGQTTCSIKSNAAFCKAPPGGTACVGSVPSCCDACGRGGCATGSTTTTVPSATTTTTTTLPGSPSGAFLDRPERLW